MFRTQYNYQVSEGVINTEPSMTVPDQSLSLRELLVNYTRGNDLPINKAVPVFSEDEHYPDLRKMDLVDLQELALANASKAAKLSQQLRKSPVKNVVAPAPTEYPLGDAPKEI